MNRLGCCRDLDKFEGGEDGQGCPAVAEDAAALAHPGNPGAAVPWEPAQRAAHHPTRVLAFKILIKYENIKQEVRRLG